MTDVLYSEKHSEIFGHSEPCAFCSYMKRHTDSQNKCW